MYWQLLSLMSFENKLFRAANEAAVGCKCDANPKKFLLCSCCCCWIAKKWLRCGWYVKFCARWLACIGTGEIKLGVRVHCVGNPTELPGEECRDDPDDKLQNEGGGVVTLMPLLEMFSKILNKKKIYIWLKWNFCKKFIKKNYTVDNERTKRYRAFLHDETCRIGRCSVMERYFSRNLRFI